MKKCFFIAVAGLLCLSCSDSGEGSNDDNSTGSFEKNNPGFEDNGTVYEYDGDNPNNTTTESTISGKIYMVEERDSMGHFIYTDETMLEVGIVENGKVSLNLPLNIDSRFLQNISEQESPPQSLTIKPLDVEIMFQTERLHIMNGYDNVGNLMYGKLEEVNGEVQGFDEIVYCYFSKDTEMKGVVGNEEYKISAKRGWNKVYRSSHLNEDYEEGDKNYVTTNLDEAPSGLEWIVY